MKTGLLATSHLLISSEFTKRMISICIYNSCVKIYAYVRENEEMFAIGSDKPSESVSATTPFSKIDPIREIVKTIGKRKIVELELPLGQTWMTSYIAYESLSKKEIPIGFNIRDIIDAVAVKMSKSDRKQLLEVRDSL